jgi:hypothetical protein
VLALAVHLAVVDRRPAARRELDRDIELRLAHGAELRVGAASCVRCGLRTSAVLLSTQPRSRWPGPPCSGGPEYRPAPKSLPIQRGGGDSQNLKIS